MNNPILISESFERAASSLTYAMERFSSNSPLSYDMERFAFSVELFRSSVDKLQTLLGMQAENDHRKMSGESLAYREDAFNSV